MMRSPDYERGRFFISPILGCNAQCYFCYIYDKGYAKKISKNSFSIESSIDYLMQHDDFQLGVNGSIISIGAWGDPFPRYNKNACYFTLNWLKKLVELQNPIQIMSRYELHEEIIDGIIECNKYKGQILYSTSISSLSQFRAIEPYSDEPESRLKSLSTLRDKGIATNVMIKPFISGITDTEITEFIDIFKTYSIKHCVVGDLLVNNRVKEKFETLEFTNSLIKTTNLNQVLDCTSGESYEINTTENMLSFVSELSDYGIKVFKKSSCVNSFILNKKNPANYIEFDPNCYCIQCGVCV
ncbi:hypothetical protein L4D77_22660 [Photobacterium frigidiphilum]|uniref:hypothetical protein n=1 Tax=Photobacterium frigidiphilum TaxID=264736 RepID=UPI003D151F0A